VLLIKCQSKKLLTKKAELNFQETLIFEKPLLLIVARTAEFTWIEIADIVALYGQNSLRCN
jgi:hypothetical protein